MKSNDELILSVLFLMREMCLAKMFLFNPLISLPFAYFLTEKYSFCSVLSAASFSDGLGLRQSESLRESRRQPLQEVSFAERWRFRFRIQRAVLSRLRARLTGMESVSRGPVACECVAR